MIPVNLANLDSDCLFHRHPNDQDCPMQLLQILFRGSDRNSTNSYAKPEAHIKATAITATDTVGIHLSYTVGQVKHRF